MAGVLQQWHTQLHCHCQGFATINVYLGVTPSLLIFSLPFSGTNNLTLFKQSFFVISDTHAQIRNCKTSTLSLLLV